MNNTFTQQVDGFCKKVGLHLFTLLGTPDNDINIHTTNLLTCFDWFGLEISVVKSLDTDYNSDETTPTHGILLFTDIATGESEYVKLSGFLSSYGSPDYSRYKLVKKTTKTVEVFE